jgi:hypothetical protein
MNTYKKKIFSVAIVGVLSIFSSSIVRADVVAPSIIDGTSDAVVVTPLPAATDPIDTGVVAVPVLPATTTSSDTGAVLVIVSDTPATTTSTDSGTVSVLIPPNTIGGTDTSGGATLITPPVVTVDPITPQPIASTNSSGGGGSFYGNYSSYSSPQSSGQNPATGNEIMFSGPPVIISLSNTVIAQAQPQPEPIVTPDQTNIATSDESVAPPVVNTQTAAVINTGLFNNVWTWIILVILAVLLGIGWWVFNRRQKEGN